MQQSLIFLPTDELFIHILLCHRLYISIVFVDFFLTSCCTLIPYSLILLRLQQLNLENSLQMIRINC